MTPAEQLALWADRLRDLSAMGLRFAENVYQFNSITPGEIDAT